MYLCDVYVNSTPGWLESFAVFFPKVHKYVISFQDCNSKAFDMLK